MQFSKVEELNTQVYRELYRFVKKIRFKFKHRTDAENHMFKTLLLMIKNEKKLSMMAVEPMRQVDVFRKAILSVLDDLLMD